eukprot:TRINITY_DN32985_c0_g1_i1.p1 TRINITY_DN32985_c0_g1~~TRINITY_DN32985_c0_g1_i1.p1  ORF type:complete len:117 (-),score=4.50 TRINITY_DN32985_c0_g1_i1:129-479(-)
MVELCPFVHTRTIPTPYNPLLPGRNPCPSPALFPDMHMQSQSHEQRATRLAAKRDELKTKVKELTSQLETANKETDGTSSFSISPLPQLSHGLTTELPPLALPRCQKSSRPPCYSE